MLYCLADSNCLSEKENQTTANLGTGNLEPTTFSEDHDLQVSSSDLELPINCGFAAGQNKCDETAFTR